MSNADISSSSWSHAAGRKSRRRSSHVETCFQSDLVPKQEPVEEYSTQSENDLTLRRTKSASASYSRSRQRSSQIPQTHSFTLLELSDKDAGYDADVEVVQPSAYDEPETDTDMPNAYDLPNLRVGTEAQLTARLKGLHIRNRTRQRSKAKHVPDRVATTASFSKSHKRGFSESFESESEYEASEFGGSDLGSPHGAKRSRKGHRKSHSSGVVFTTLEYGSDIDTQKVGENEILRAGGLVSASIAQDAMDLDE